MKFSAVAYRTIILASAATAAESSSKKVEEVPFKWPNPFRTKSLKEHEPPCGNSITLFAAEYILHDLYEAYPDGLWPWANALQVFFSGQEYPGSWDGNDPHGYNRTVLKMDNAEFPKPVRRWISAHGEKLLAIYDKPMDKWKKVSAPEKAPNTMAAKDKFKEEEQEVDSRIAILAPGGIVRSTATLHHRG